MADEKVPDPTIGTPAGTEGKESESMAKDILNELDKVGIKSKEDLGNMAKASSEAGNLARMLGEIRNENAQLRDMLQNRPPQQSPAPDPLYEEDRPATMGEIRGLLRDMQTATDNARKQAWGEYAEIQNDPDYPVFEAQFQKTLGHPNVQSQLNTGQITMRSVYDNVVRDGLKSVLHQMREKVEEVAATPGRAAPHIESGTHTDPTVQTFEKTDKQENLEKILKNRTGTDDDVDAMLDAILPKGDLTRMRFTT